MNKGRRLAILGLVVAVCVTAFLLRQSKRSTVESDGAVSAAASAGEISRGSELPRLVDLGSDKCIPCKMMAPILEELKREYTSKFIVEVIDVRKDRAAGEEFGIRVIPTQIFVDASGVEVFRHEGFISKEDILLKWKELGVDTRSDGS